MVARKDILPTYLNRPAFRDLMDAVDSVFKATIDDPAVQLRKLRTLWPFNPNSAEEIAEVQRLLTVADFDQFDRETLLKQLNLIGFTVRSARWLSDAQLARFFRNVSTYWYSKGTVDLQDFLSFTLEAEVKINLLWTEDYVTFLPEGSPGIGTPLYNGGTWYPTTHIGVDLDAGVLSADFTVENFTQLLEDLCNYPLVIKYVSTTSVYWFATESGQVIPVNLAVIDVQQDIIANFTLTSADITPGRMGGGYTPINWGGTLTHLSGVPIPASAPPPPPIVPTPTPPSGGGGSEGDVIALQSLYLESSASSGPSSMDAFFTFASTGQIVMYNQFGSVGDSAYPQFWFDTPAGGVGNDYWARAHVVSGSIPDRPGSAGLDAWIQLSSDRSWGIQRSGLLTSDSVNSQVEVQISSSNTGTPVLGTTTLNFSRVGLSGGPTNFGATVLSVGAFLQYTSVIFMPNGDIDYIAAGSGGTTTPPNQNWFTPLVGGIGASYMIRATLLSGDPFTSGNTGVWEPLNTDKEWSLARSGGSGGSTAACSFLVEISNGVSVVCSGTINFDISPA